MRYLKSPAQPAGFTPHIDSILAYRRGRRSSTRQELIKRATDLISRVLQTKVPAADKSTATIIQNFQGNYHADGNLISITETILDITPANRLK